LAFVVVDKSKPFKLKTTKQNYFYRDTKHLNLGLFKVDLFRQLELLVTNQLINTPKEVDQIISDFIKIVNDCIDLNALEKNLSEKSANS